MKQVFSEEIVNKELEALFVNLEQDTRSAMSRAIDASKYQDAATETKEYVGLYAPRKMTIMTYILRPHNTETQDTRLEATSLGDAVHKAYIFLQEDLIAHGSTKLDASFLYLVTSFSQVDGVEEALIKAHAGGGAAREDDPLFYIYLEGVHKSTDIDDNSF